MRLSKLYTSKPEVFSPIVYRPGVNVILAEIRLPENRTKDTHNLGKSTVGRLIDFLFLARRDSRFFLFKHIDRFDDFVFFLEIELIDGTYLTVRRSVHAATKIALKKHDTPDQDFSRLGEAGWDHFDLPFERARSLLDSLLNWRGLKPWNYRNILGYLLRSQDDYRDVFQLGKFASAHADWKPFLAHLLGFDGNLVAKQYSQESKLAEEREKADTLRQELGTDGLDDASKIDGMLLLKTADLKKKQDRLDAFDFRLTDKELNKQVTNEIDEEIASLNSRRYTLTVNRKKIVKSLDEGTILFDPDEAQALFSEAGVLFDGQIKRDFQQLIEFNKAITEERRTYLREDLAEIEGELKEINAALNVLGKKRSEALSFLSDSDAFDKYRALTNEMVILRAEVAGLEKQRALLHRLHNIRNDVRTQSEQLAQTQAAVEADVEAQNADVSSRFSKIRLFFNEIIEDVLDRKALLSVAINKAGHLDFHAEILDEAGNTTSADLGFTYKKLLCVAFDLAVLRAHSGEPFPRFAFHDGIFESLDNRKKENLLDVLRRYAELGLQEIITLIDSDIPPGDGTSDVFDKSEISLILHDEGEDGRLFRAPPW